MAEPARKITTWSPTRSPTPAAPTKRMALFADALAPRPISAPKPRWPNLRWLAGELAKLAAIAGVIWLAAWAIWR